MHSISVLVGSFEYLIARLVSHPNGVAFYFREVVVKISTEEILKKEIADLANQLMADWPSSRNRQKQFVLEYVANGFINASDAARRAGYSDKNVNNTASNMLSGINKFVHISDVVNQLKKAYEERSEALKIATGTEVLQYLTSMMRGNETEQTLRGIGEGAQVIDTIDVSAKDRIKAAELIGKRYGIWTEKQEIELSGGVQFIDDI